MWGLLGSYNGVKNIFGKPSLLLVTQLIFLFLPGSLHAFDKGYLNLDRITESVKTMLEDGLPQQEIINTIKLELSMRRVKALVGKMYDGGELTEEEVSELKSGEIDEDNEELKLILKKFGMGLLNSNSTQDFLSKTKKSERYHGSDQDVSLEDNRSEHYNQLPKPDYAFSPFDQIRLVGMEESIYKPLKKYIKRVEAKLKLLKSYTNDYEDTSLKVTKANMNFEDRATAIVSNPLTSYRMIRRFAFKLPEVWSSLGEDLEEVLWNDLSQIKMKYQPPNDQDWKDSIEALFRIQYYNQYHAKPMANGDLGSIKSKVELTAEECMEIGLRGLALKKYDFALEWLYLARNKYLNGDGGDSFDLDVEFLEESLQFAIKEHNQAWDALQGLYTKSHIFTKKLIDPKYIESAQRAQFVIKEAAKEYRTVEEYGYPVAVNFASLCAGENLQTEEEKSRLHCWLERSHPYFIINPIKMELLNSDPYLLQVYEIIGDKLIDRVKRTATTKLQRSQVVNYDDPNADDVSLVRTSSQTWIPQWDLRRVGLENLTKLIEKVTGLNTRRFGSSEDFQVACYGTSHHYEEHLDAVQDPRRTAEFGERIGTFMLYLSTVEEGGKTAFPVLGVSANPIKGSAVFWYNLKKNGEPDKRTWHGGCPVVHGIKWVMNNWILSNENSMNRPCGLNSDE